MDREVDLIEFLPNVLREVQEFKAISQAENPELSTLWQAIGDILDDQFINDATENGVKRWESILSLLPKGTDSLEVRKFRILSRLNEQIPYTYGTLEQQLRTLCGENGYALELDHDTYTLKVRVSLVVKQVLDEIDSFLKRTAPANLVIDLSLEYNRHSTFSSFTHSELSNYTHYQLRNEVIV